MWVAWQGWRNGRAAIFAAGQQGSAFRKPAPVSASQANEWNPAIAADGDRARHGGLGLLPQRQLRRLPAHAAVDRNLGRGDARGGLGAVRGLSIARLRPPGAAVGGLGGRRGALGQGLRRLRHGRHRALPGARRPAARLRRRQGRSTRPRTSAACCRACPASAPTPTARQAGAAGWERPDPNNAKNRAAEPPAGNVGRRRTACRGCRSTLPGACGWPSAARIPVWWNPTGTVWSEHVASYDGGEVDRAGLPGAHRTTCWITVRRWSRRCARAS